MNRGQRVLEVDMSNGCHVKTRSGASKEHQYTPLVAAGGREVVVDLEAAAGPWNIGAGYAPLDGWSYNGVTPDCATADAHAGFTGTISPVDRNPSS